MYGLIRWSQPELSTFENRVARLFHDAFGNGFGRDAFAAWTPVLNIEEQTDAIRVSAEVPGWTPEQIKVQVEGNELSISGTKQDRSFARTFTLPATVDVEAITARTEHGVLTVTLPKHAKEQPRQIAVQVA